MKPSAEASFPGFGTELSFLLGDAVTKQLERVVMRGPSWPKAVLTALFAATFGASQGLGAQLPTQRSDPAFWTRGTDDKLDGPTPDLTQPCAGPNTTPLCTLKTYLACVLYDAPDLCAAAGFQDMPKRYPGDGTLDTEVLKAPWSLSFDRLMPEAFALHIYDAGRVPGSRFQTLRAGDGSYEQIAAYTSGAYELVVDIPEPYVKGMVYRQSVFFREAAGRWHVIAWSSTRAAACDAAAGTASWAPCRWFVKNLRQRDVFAGDVKPLWAAAKPPARDDYPHPGLEIMMGLPNQPVVAPFAGVVLRRSLKYPDVPLYDWVVIQGDGPRATMTAKFALVDRTGPAPGQHVNAAEPLGKPEWVESEHPGAGRFIHIELLRDGAQIDPRTVMRERKAQEPVR